MFLSFAVYTLNTKWIPLNVQWEQARFYFHICVSYIFWLNSAIFRESCDMAKLWLTIYKFVNFQLNCDSHIRHVPTYLVNVMGGLACHKGLVCSGIWHTHRRQKTVNHIYDSTSGTRTCIIILVHLTVLISLLTWSVWHMVSVSDNCIMCVVYIN